nr:unnamed protein product [Callosobruchus chinensis]
MQSRKGQFDSSVCRP